MLKAAHVIHSANPDGGDAADAEMAVLSLDPGGQIRDCNQSAEHFFQYPRAALLSQPVAMVLPQLAGLDLLPSGQPNPRLRFLSRIGCCFFAVTRDGRRFPCELYLNLLDDAGSPRLVLVVRAARGASLPQADGRSN